MTRFLTAIAVAWVTLAGLACGPSVPQADPKNSTACPAGADASPSLGTSCPQAGLVCNYTIAPRPCGAGSTTAEVLTCSQGADGGTTWSTLVCL